MNDVMIDIETLSLKQNATILSMAAVMFDITTGNIGAQLHIACIIAIQNRDIDRAVINWWAEPKQAVALAEMDKFLVENPYRLDLALSSLSKFIARHQPKQIWGNSPSFDLAILSDAYRQHDMPVPWPFWNERDCRTLLNTCRQITDIDPKKQINVDGTSHTALADAMHQARYVSAAFNALKKVTP